MALSLTSTTTLNNGVAMPWLGLGVYQMSGAEARKATLAALKTGYRSIDTARIYGNEAETGQTIRDSGIPRDQIFVTTKLWNGDHGFEDAQRAFDGSLKKMGLDYLDLFLIHWPVHGKRRDSWRGLEKILESKRVRAIGVSNYTERHLTELMNDSQIVPQVNQVEFHPFLYQAKLLEFCKMHRIQFEAYSPLSAGHRLRDPNVGTIAKKHGRSAAQIMIRWSLQHGVVAIPKSVRPERIAENSKVFDFELSADDMKALDKLNENLHTDWDPTNAP